MRILFLPLPRGVVKRALFVRVAALALHVAVLAGCVGDGDVDAVLPDAPPICACDPPMRLNLRPASDAGSPLPSATIEAERGRP